MDRRIRISRINNEYSVISFFLFLSYLSREKARSSAAVLSLLIGRLNRKKKIHPETGSTNGHLIEVTYYLTEDVNKICFLSREGMHVNIIVTLKSIKY